MSADLASTSSAAQGPARDEGGRLVPPPIAAHRLLGDGASTALVMPDGTIDWWCAPSLDDPPLLWSLLDDRGALAAWNGARMIDADGPPAGPTARTTLRHAARGAHAPGGQALHWDGLLCGAGTGTPADRTHHLVRLVQGIGRNVEVEHVLALGGLGSSRQRWVHDGGAVLTHLDDGTEVRVAVVGDRSATLELVGDDPTLEIPPDARLEPLVVRARFWAPHDAWAGLVVSFDPPADGSWPPSPAAVVTELEAVEAAEACFLEATTLPEVDDHCSRASDALVVLRACTYMPTGAVVAAPTTSLPEAPGGDRQFDYRYTWLRDGSLAVSVAAQLGATELAGRYVRFIVEQAGGAQVPSGPMTDVRGETVPAERTVSGARGWAGSQPIRFGNAAGDQVQYDALGFLLEAIDTYTRLGGPLSPSTWHLVAGLADQAAGADGELTSGIWELREPRHLVSADIGRWLALTSAIRIARRRRPWTRTGPWSAARDGCRDRVLAAIGPDGGLPQAYDGDASEADASALMAVIFGLVAPDDPRAERLVAATLRHLGAWPFVYRYEPGGDDGFVGAEGAFVPCSWWAVSALARIGLLDDAEKRFRAVERAVPRLQPEEVDPESLLSLGNTPLVWSHMEAARALFLIEAARTRSSRTAIGYQLWAWRRHRRTRVRRRPVERVRELLALRQRDEG